MDWLTPEIFEVKMDAEIGSYQVDDERDELPFAAPEHEESSETGVRR
jgi:hypothetical protein